MSICASCHQEKEIDEPCSKCDKEFCSDCCGDEENLDDYMGDYYCKDCFPKCPICIAEGLEPQKLEYVCEECKTECCCTHCKSIPGETELCSNCYNKLDALVGYNEKNDPIVINYYDLEKAVYRDKIKFRYIKETKCILTINKKEYIFTNPQELFKLAFIAINTDKEDRTKEWNKLYNSKRKQKKKTSILKEIASL